ncbi:MAG: hypothetical protein HYX94_11995 [Chloroflexi bacterium]|nr:hypothetical protein [Chloroflexota bacterium]
MRPRKSCQLSHESLGWLPAIALIVACSLVVVAIADLAARNGQAWAEPVFWIGLLGIYLPVALRLVSPAVGRQEGLGLVVALGLSLYLVKVLYSPLVFSFPDEFMHWRTANDIGLSGRLFLRNPLLPVSAVYPGQEIVTSALATLSGSSIFHAGLVVVGAARLLLLVALYATYELLSRSPRVAGIAVVIYMANPNYLFFGAGFDYESVALPAATIFVLVLLCRQEATGSARWRLTAVALAVLGLTVTTHHLTSYLLSGFLLVWLLGNRLVCRDKGKGPGAIAIVAPLVSLLWLVTVGSTVIGYLAPHVLSTLGELASLVAGESGAGRQLFQSTTGYVAPLWERLTAIGSAGLVVAALPPGLFLVWRRYRDHALALTLAVTALVYPASLALRFTGRGWEMGNRLSAFVFIGIAFVAALTVVALLQSRPSAIRTSLVGLSIALMFTGGVIGGWPPQWRLPASHLQNAEVARDDPEAIAAALWARDFLGPDNHVAAEAVPMAVMGSYGRQDIETTLSGGVDARWIILSPGVGQGEMRQLRRGQVEYIVVDRRLGSQGSGSSSYYPGVPRSTALAKFDGLGQTSRVFDSGNLQIYDVRQLVAAGEDASVP